MTHKKDETHTGGPWHVVRFDCPEDEPHFYHDIIGEGGRVVVGDSGVEGCGNARLIAAAPALLAACRAALSELRQGVGYGAMEELRYAIKIATGRDS